MILYRLFLNEIVLPVAKLYPPVKFPVPAGTPMIAPLIRWNHSGEDWYVPKFEIEGRNKSEGGQTYKINLNDPKFEYISGHVFDGRVILKVL